MFHGSSSNISASGSGAVRLTAQKTPPPSAGAMRRAQSLIDVTPARDQNEPSLMLRMRRARSDTLFADDCLDQVIAWV